MMAQVELDRDAFFDGRDALLVQPGTQPLPCLVRKFGREYRTAPELLGVAQRPRPGRPGSVAGRGDMSTESEHVHAIAGHVQSVGVTDRGDSGHSAERGPQAADPDLDAVARSGRRVGAEPGDLGQPAELYGLAGPQGKHPEHQALAALAQLKRLAVPPDIERAEDADRWFVHAQPPPRFGLRCPTLTRGRGNAARVLPSPYPTVAHSLATGTRTAGRERVGASTVGGPGPRPAAAA